MTRKERRLLWRLIRKYDLNALDATMTMIVASVNGLLAGARTARGFKRLEEVA